MADTTNTNLTPDDSIVRKSALQYYDSKLKAWVNTQVSNAIDGGFKDVKYANSTLYFFDETAPTSADEYAAKAVKSVSLPEEQLLDQAKTVFAENFAWSETAYPSSVNPNLDGKPVLVLAVKGEGSDVAYSFVSLEKLIDIYTGGATGSATTTVSADNKITVDVKVSAETDNTVVIKNDGVYVPSVATDLDKKADKVTGAVEGNFAKLDANGNLADAGVKEADFVKKITTIAGIGLADNVTKGEMLTALNVADGAQVNVIETVKVNGTALDVTSKAIDVTVATGATDGTLAVNGVDIAVKGYSDLATAVGTNTANIDTNTKAIAKLNGADTEVGSVAYAVKELADGAVKANADAIAVLNGNETTEGSVAKAIKDYKDSIVYTNNDDIDALFATV